MTSETYETLNKAWKQTCKIIFGGEVGELKDYEAWLTKGMEKPRKSKSALSGKDVYSAVPYYCKDARFISFDEIDFGKTFEPLNINQVKDIDSIVEALQERFVYTGNVILGNSKDIEGSSNVQNSSHIFGSTFAFNCEYNAYCYGMTRTNKYAFGIFMASASEFIINAYVSGRKSSRCFEIWHVTGSSDCYYCFNCDGMHDVLFSFNQRGKKNMIGNLELPRDKYAGLKAKLLAEMREGLVAEKGLPSLMEIVSGSKKRPEIRESNVKEEAKTADMGAIEKAFGETARVVLGKELHGIDSYGAWLMRHIPNIEKAKSFLSGKTIYRGLLAPHSLLATERLVTEKEAWAIGGSLKLASNEIVSLGSIKENIGKIALLTPELSVGENRNTPEAMIVDNSINCYKGIMMSAAENAGFCYYPRDSKYMFGDHTAINSNFCMKGSYSSNITRAFEVDSCTDCADIYYAHNCENVHDSMFCFNVKNVRNAIGNGALPLEKYKAVKKSLLEQIVSELEKKKTLKWDIYNIGCAA
jgi:hypothetical protein